MNIMRYSVGLLAVFILSATAIAGESLNSTPAVQGYDVVSYQNAKRPVRGNGNYISQYKGAVYLFSSEKNREIFMQDPGRYAPAYGGFCAYGVSVGKKFIGDPEVWRVVENKLYLNLDTSIQAIWMKDMPSYIKEAGSQWIKIKNKSFAAL